MGPWWREAPSLLPVGIATFSDSWAGESWHICSLTCIQKEKVFLAPLGGPWLDLRIKLTERV